MRQRAGVTRERAAHLAGKKKSRLQTSRTAIFARPRSAVSWRILEPCVYQSAGTPMDRLKPLMAVTVTRGVRYNSLHQETTHEKHCLDCSPFFPAAGHCSILKRGQEGQERCPGRANEKR